MQEKGSPETGGFRALFLVVRGRQLFPIASGGLLFRLPPAAYFLSAATKSMQKTPLETLGFKTFFVVYKSFRLNPAKAGNWRISIIAAAALGDGGDLLFYRGNKKKELLGTVGRRRYVPYRKRSDWRKIVRRGQKRAGKVCRRKRER